VEGWIEIALSDTDSGFVGAAEKESAETSEEKPVDGVVIPEQDDTDGMITLAAGTEIYSAADPESDVIMTLEEDTSFMVKNEDVEGWLEIALNDTDSGFVAKTDEETDDEKELSSEVKTPGTIILAAGTEIYSAADPESDVIMTLEEDTTFTVKNADVEGWLEIALNDTDSGFVAVDEEADDEKASKTVILAEGTEIYAAADLESDVIMILEEETTFTVKNSDMEGWLEIVLNETESGFVVKPDDYDAVKLVENQVLVTAGTNLRAEADGMSEIIYTFVEDEIVVVEDDLDDWLYVTTADGVSGYLFKGDVPDYDGPTKEKKVTIFTSRRSVMQLGEDIHLTSVLEGFEEGIEVKYQWQCDKGNGFEAIPGANGSTYTYQASVETLSWSWRLVVSIPD
jgi:uncharacterized protein YgiM (DUF1202 family)